MAYPYSVHVPAANAPLTGACPTASPIFYGWVKAANWGANSYVIPFELNGSNWVGVTYLVAVSTTQLGGMFLILDPAFAWDYPAIDPTQPTPQWTDTVTQGQRDGWIGVALQVVVGGGNVTFRMWRCYGAGADMVGPYTETWAYNTIHSGWTPASLSTVTLGENNASTDPADVTAVRLYDSSSVPSNASIKSLLNSLAPDSNAFADWPMTWINGSSVPADQSGHGRNLTVNQTLTQGSAGPIDSSVVYTASLSDTVAIAEAAFAGIVGGAFQADAFQTDLLQIQVLECARIHLAQAQADPALVGIDSDHTQGYHVAFMQTGFLGVFDAVFADLRDVDQAFHAAFDLNKSTIIS